MGIKKKILYYVVNIMLAELSIDYIIKNKKIYDR